ncbi:MAG: hypothetical protein KC656_33285, partial [Myxococcales bacterium]|nr:hypothetical protein [Myxococcales bacterium]
MSGPLPPANLADIDLPYPSDSATEKSWRAWQHRRSRRVGKPSAWLFETVAWLGRWVDITQRVAWGSVEFPADTRQDDKTRALWVRWSQGDVWGPARHWHARFHPAAERAFRSVMTGARVPSDVRARVLDELREGFLVALHADRESPGWWDLAGRTLETQGPVEALVASMDEVGISLLASCIASRRSPRRQLVESLWPHQSRQQRVHTLHELLMAGHAEAWCDAEVLFRLLAHWREGRHADPQSIGNLLVQVRGRMRSNLRAVALRECTDTAMERLLALDGLALRTERAVARLAERWAWEELSRRFPMGEGPSVVAGCEVPGVPEPLDADQAGMAWTWVLLVVLRGRLEVLDRWVVGAPNEQ